MSYPDHQPRAWLPREALENAHLDEEIDTALARWSRKWLAGAPWLARTRLSSDRPPDMAGLRWSGLAEGIAVGLAPDAGHAIASAMLGVQPSQSFKEPNDLVLADALANMSLSDFRKRLAQLFRLSADCGWNDGDIADLLKSEPIYFTAIGAVTGRPQIQLAVTHELLIAWIKVSLSGPAQPIVLGSLDESLARQPVELGARVGGCALSLTELDALGVGDVIVLDRLLEGPLELALDGRAIGRRCAVDQRDGRLAIEMFEPILG